MSHSQTSSSTLSFTVDCEKLLELLSSALIFDAEDHPNIVFQCKHKHSSTPICSPTLVSTASSVVVVETEESFPPPPPTTESVDQVDSHTAPISAPSGSELDYFLFPSPPKLPHYPEASEEVEDGSVEVLLTSPPEKPVEMYASIGKGGKVEMIPYHSNIQYRRIVAVSSTLAEDSMIVNYPVYTLNEHLVRDPGEEILMTYVDMIAVNESHRSTNLRRENNCMRQLSFYAVPTYMIPELDSLKEKLQTVYDVSTDTPHPNILVPGCAVVAQYNDEWYRAIVVDQKSTNYHIRYVDYGNDEIKAISELRLIKPEFLVFSPMAQRCQLTNVAHFPYPMTGERLERIVEQVVENRYYLFIASRHIDQSDYGGSYVKARLCETESNTPVRLLPDLCLEMPPPDSFEPQTSASITPSKPRDLQNTLKTIDPNRLDWYRDAEQAARVQSSRPLMFELTNFVDPGRFYIKPKYWKVEQFDLLLKESLNAIFRDQVSGSVGGYSPQLLSQVVPITLWRVGDLAVAQCSLACYSITPFLNDQNDDPDDDISSCFWRVRLSSLPTDISSIEDEQVILCYLIDVGVSKNIRVRDLYYIPTREVIDKMAVYDNIHFSQLINIPPLALQCKLAEVKPTGGSHKWPSSALDFIQTNCIGRKTLVAVDQSCSVPNPDWPGEDLWIVDVLLLSFKDGVEIYHNFSLTLIQAGLALKDTTCPKLKPSTLPELATKLKRSIGCKSKISNTTISDVTLRWERFPIPNEKEDIPVSVTHVDYDLTFYCRNNTFSLGAYENELQRLSNLLSKVVKEFQSRQEHNFKGRANYNWLRTGVHCIFQKDVSMFCRGIINMTHQKIYSILWIDKGSFEVATVSQVFPLSELFRFKSVSPSGDKLMNEALRECLEQPPLVVRGRLEHIHPSNPHNPDDMEYRLWSDTVVNHVRQLVTNKNDIKLSVCFVYPAQDDDSEVINSDINTLDEVDGTDGWMANGREWHNRPCLCVDNLLAIRIYSPSFHPSEDLQELGDNIANDDKIAYRYDRNNVDEVFLKTPALFPCYTNIHLLPAMEGQVYPVYVTHIEQPTEVFIQFEPFGTHFFPRVEGDVSFYDMTCMAIRFIYESQKNSEAMSRALGFNISMLNRDEKDRDEHLFQCCAKSPEDGLWYRAVIRRWSDTEVRIQFVDYGDSHVVPIYHVHQPMFKTVPTACVKVKLYGIRRHVDCILSAEDLRARVKQELCVYQLAYCRIKKIYRDGRLPLVELFSELQCRTPYGQNLFTHGLLDYL